jgi:UPF0716 family protein affecting phage T7 exclusion
MTILMMLILCYWLHHATVEPSTVVLLGVLGLLLLLLLWIMPFAASFCSWREAGAMSCERVNGFTRSGCFC